MAARSYSAHASRAQVMARANLAAAASLGKWAVANPAAGAAAGTAGADRRLYAPPVRPRRALAAAGGGAGAGARRSGPRRALLVSVAEPPRETTNTGGALAGVASGGAAANGDLTKRVHKDTDSVDVSKSAQDAMTHVVSSGSGLLDSKDMSSDVLATQKPAQYGGNGAVGGVANPVQSATLTIVRGGGAGGSGAGQHVVWSPANAATTPQNTPPSAPPRATPSAPWWEAPSGR